METEDGIIGQVYSGNNLIFIPNNNNYGDINFAGSQCGGIAGYICSYSSSTNGIVMPGNKNYGNMKGNGTTRIGGIVGYATSPNSNQASNINNNVNEGQILLEGGGSSKIGGIVGQFDGTNLILNSNANKENGEICIKIGYSGTHNCIRRNNRIKNQF